MKPEIKLMLGRGEEKLKELPAESVGALVTDPPYLINFMGADWDKENSPAASADYWKEVFRVMKTGAYGVVFGHSRQHHRVMVALEDAGFQIRDCLMWVYGQGFPKNRNVGADVDKLRGKERKVIGKNPNHRETEGSYKLGFQGGKGSGLITKGEGEWEGWGTALKPAYEPIILIQKPIKKGSIANNLKENGVGAMNIDACRIGNERLESIETKTETTGTGWKKHGYTTPARTGRHPANFMLSHTDECEKVGEHKEKRSGGERTKTMAGTKSNGGGSMKEESVVEEWKCSNECPVRMLNEQAPKTGNGHAPKVKVSGYGEHYGGKRDYEGSGERLGGLSGASKFFYCGKASKKEREWGTEGLEEKELCMSGAKSNKAEDIGLNKTTIRKNNHPTIKPFGIMEWLIKLITPEGEIVLDPFMGSGTTGIMCVKNSRDFIGIEMDEHYYSISQTRINYALEHYHSEEE